MQSTVLSAGFLGSFFSKFFQINMGGGEKFSNYDFCISKIYVKLRLFNDKDRNQHTDFIIF
jgi:hypothetical protein